MAAMSKRAMWLAGSLVGGHHDAMNNGQWFTHSRYLVRQKILTVLGSAFHVYDDSGRVVLYSRQKALRLREDIRLYSRPDMQEELLRIRARQVIDFGATYDVIDSGTQRPIGAVRRQGFK